MDPSRHQVEPLRVTAEFGALPAAQLDEHAVDEEPDDSGLHTAARPTYTQYISEGEAAYFQALRLEKRAGLNDSALAQYEKASSRLIDAKALVPINKHWMPTVPEDPVRLVMIADSFTKQAQAPYVRPYNDEISANAYSRVADRKENLERLAGEYLTRATRVFLGINGEELAANIPDDPRRFIASAAVEAVLSADTIEYPVPEAEIKEDTDELLQKGPEAIVAFVARHADEPDFVSKTGEIVLEELTDSNLLVAA